MQRPFMDTLREVERGVLLDELTDIQHQIVEAVQMTNKQGELTIKLKFKPEGAGQVSIETDYKPKIPQLPRGRSIFFVTPEGNLQRDDPRQKDLELKTAKTEQPAELKEAN